MGWKPKSLVTSTWLVPLFVYLNTLIEHDLHVVGVVTWEGRGNMTGGKGRVVAVEHIWKEQGREREREGWYNSFLL